MSDSPDFPTSGETGRFGTSGTGNEADNQIVRTSRTFKRMMEEYKDESRHKNFRTLTTTLTQESLSEINRITNDIPPCVDFAHRYESRISASNIGTFTYDFDKNIIQFGELNHYLNISLEPSYLASLNMIATGLNTDKSDIARASMIHSMVDWYYNKDLDIEYATLSDLESKWENFIIWANSQRREFMKFMYTNFVDLIDMSTRDTSSNMDYFESIYRALKNDRRFDKITDNVGEEPFDNIENIIKSD